MKRSEINSIIRENKALCEKYHFALPEWTNWTPSDWASKGEECLEIKRNGLGWDITDFGSGDFKKVGLSLVTIRNGNLKYDKKPYCEKIMILRPGQVTPTHFHWNKMEDIIYRGGEGEFSVKLWHAGKDEEKTDETVHLKIDGVLHSFEPGKTYTIPKGCSICFEPYTYHEFWMEGGYGLIGEVSMVNDDAADNRFYAPTGRFPAIEDDVPAEVLLCTEYPDLNK